MKIQDTLIQYGGNFARPTKFNVKLNPPKSTSGPIIDVLCKSVTLPEMTNEPIELTYKGQKINIPGRNKQAQSVTLTFYVDENHSLRKLFEEWIQLCDEHHFIGNGQRQTSNKFGDMILDALDFNEKNRVLSYRFHNVFPTSVGESEFSAADKDTIMEFSVTFSYYKMEQL